MTKPPGSLGRLESIAERLCAIGRTLEPRVDRRRIVVFAADHGVTRAGISAYPSEVTAQMVANFLAGGAAINALARMAGADLWVVDMGVAASIPGSEPGAADMRSGTCFVRRPLAAGTEDFTRGPAMSKEQMVLALETGIDMAERAASDGVSLIGLGEMGIGNTTAASAITAALTGLDAALVTGRGTGADDATYARKVRAVQDALALNRPDRHDALDILRKVGGFEIAGLCGLTLGCAAAGIPVLTDGFIATAGAALAVRLQPAVASYVLASHLSVEPGHAALLDAIGERPLLDLGLRLGEGTGAALAMNVVASAAAAFREMATFESAGVSNRDELPRSEPS